MKKIVKASIATTAGVILLLGGAGTFATWNSSANAEGAAITAGNLEVDGLAETAGVWTTADGTTIDIAGYRIVPGDVLTYTKAMKVGAEGDSLNATLGLSEESISPVDPNNAADVALDSYLQTNAVLTIAGEGITETGANTFAVTPNGEVVAQDVTVTVTVTFPAGDAGGNNDAMNGEVTLDDLTVTLTQNIG
jgi:alternate signal-mediated exported protein